MNHPFIQKYVHFLTEKGYSTQTIHAYSKAVERVPQIWDSVESQDLYEHINNVLATRNKFFTVNVSHNIKPALSLLFLMVTGITFKEYVAKLPKRDQYSIILNEFYQYSTGFKGIITTSAKAECNHVSKFLNQFINLPDAWSLITANDIRDYVMNSLSELKPSSKGRYITSLRNFFRFLEYKEIPVNQSILKLPLAPADWKKSNIPVILTNEEECRLRKHYDLNTEKGKRNHIIISLMLDLGLRCVEVTGLELSDIKWNNGIILLKNTKNKRMRELPIPQKLGSLLEEYVIHCRPKTDDKHLFLRKTINNKHVAMSRESIRSVIRYAFNQENIKGWWKGTHALRRTAASHVYNTGNGLKMTADLLGHKSLDSTKQYVKLDFESLRKIPSSWPRGESNER
jgi:site-specific recombinase XerD